MKEKCTRCGRETEYEVSTPVTVRRYYVEGAGQLCEECFHILYPVPGAFVNNGMSSLMQQVEDDYSK